MERVFYCMKYHKLVNGKELRRCLARFTYFNKDGQKITGICPQLYDLLENKPYYKTVFSNNGESLRRNKTSDNEGSDYWTRKNKEWRSFIEGLKKLDPSDMFRESKSRLHKSKKENLNIKR